MKTLTKVTLIAAGLAVAAVPLLNAAAAKHPRLRELLVRKAVRERVAQKLDLSGDQIAQLKSARTQAVDSLKAIRHDQSLTREQKKAKAREVLESVRGEMRGALNHEQLKKLHRVREHLRARRSGAI
jgi:hypothetical protein